MMQPMFPATAMPDPDWWQVLWPDPGTVVTKLGVRPGMVVVDLCCGDGLFTVPLAAIAQNRVYGIDIDPDLLKKAQAATAAAQVPGCLFLLGDATDLATLVHEPIDYVFLANTFHGVPDKTGLSRAVASVLKPGGLLVIVNWHPRPREQTNVLGQPRGPSTEMRMSPADVRAVVEPAGLLTDGVIELPPYHYGAMFRKRP